MSRLDEGLAGQPQHHSLVLAKDSQLSEFPEGMIWIPLDPSVNGGSTDQLEADPSPRTAGFNPLAVIQLFAGSGHHSVDPGFDTWPADVVFSSIADDGSEPAEGVASSRWSLPIAGVIAAAGYVYQRRIQHRNRETLRQPVSPSL